MRKILIIILSLLLLVSCTSKDDQSYRVVAVDFPSYDAARAVMGTSDDLAMLLPPGVETHHYEPNANDMIEISNADLVIYTGGESDVWVDKILSSLDNPFHSFKLVDQVKLLVEETKDGMTVNEDEEEEDEEIDEHVWTSIPNEIRIVENLCKELCMIYPDRQDEFISNTNLYIESLNRLDEEIRKTVENSKTRTLIFASRFPLRYFVEEYSLDYYAAFPGCAEETEPSARTVAFLINKLKEDGIKYVLTIEFSSPMLARTIAEEAGAEIREFNSMHNITKNEFERGENYISLMEKNLDVLKEVLN